MIHNKSLSFEAVKADLISYVENKPANQKWKDFVGTGVGVTFIELLASVSIYKAFQEMVRRRESYLDTALFNSSVQELAFNRGYMQAPVLAATITLTLMPAADFAVVTGDAVGTYDIYQLIAYETKSFVAGESATLLCVVGNIQTIASTISGVPAFQKYSYSLNDTYIASQLEQFKVDGVVVPLMSELNYLSSAGNDFMLRRVVDNVVKIYSGNGIVGYYNPSATNTTYRCITYGTVPSDGAVNFDYSAEVVAFVFTTEASYGHTVEELRSIALYYPLDGRISQDRDYESTVTKFFGGVITDVYSFNDNPNQHISLLVESILPDSKITEISQMIDLRRQQGIQVFYHQFLVTDGKTMAIGFKLSDQDSTSENIILVQKYVENLYLNKFFKKNTVVSSFQIAIDITQIYGFPIYPVSDQQFSYIAGDYVKDINLTFTTL